MKVWDISRPLKSSLAPWPEDVPFRFDRNLRIYTGSSVNLGSISMSVHNGTHADAPFHFDASGVTIEQMPLENYFGRAVVIELSGRFSQGGKEVIEISDLVADEEAIREATRILLKTNMWPDSSVFPSWIPVIAPDVAEWLGARGVRLIGFDVPSVDAITAKVLSNHHALHRAKICIVESLDLSAVPAGLYQFSALPLRVVGSDGAPVRAVLWRES